MSKAQTFAVITLVVMATLWAAQNVLPQIMWMRIIVNFALLGSCLAVFGRTPRGKFSQESVYLALIFVAVYAIAIVITMVVFGGAVNMLVQSTTMMMYNTFFVGSTVVAQEIIRRKVIRASDRSDRDMVVIAITIAFALARLPMAEPGTDWVFFIFALVLFSLMLNGLLGSIAMSGSLAAMLLVAFGFGLFTGISPVLPNVDGFTWSLIASGIIFVCWHVYLRATSDMQKWQKARLKRIAKTRPGFPFITVISIGVIALFAAFAVGVFSYYPKAVVSGSMSGTFERGSLVIIERIAQDAVFDALQRGDVIHFRRGGMEITHRIVEYRFDDGGRRVFLTRGDANADIDPLPVAPEDILGIVRMVMPHFGMPNILLRTILGI